MGVIVVDKQGERLRVEVMNDWMREEFAAMWEAEMASRPDLTLRTAADEQLASDVAKRLADLEGPKNCTALDLEALMGEPVPGHFPTVLGPAPADTHTRFERSRREALRRGIEFELTSGHYQALLAAGSCFYCGGSIVSGGCGLDRKDPEVGYLPGNVVPACGNCNKAKLSHPFATWKAISDAAIAALGPGRVWPTEPIRTVKQRRHKMEAAKYGQAIGRGIYGLARWTVIVAIESERRVRHAAWCAKMENAAGRRGLTWSPPTTEEIRATRARNRIAREMDEAVKIKRGQFMWRGKVREAKSPFGGQLEIAQRAKRKRRRDGARTPGGLREPGLKAANPLLSWHGLASLLGDTVE